MLDVQSNTKGVLLPRMTSTQRDNISTPATGLMIFNTTTGCLEINLGMSASPSWQSIRCTPGTVATLDCQTATISELSNAPLVQNVAATGVTITLPYTGGDGKAYDSQSFPSTGVVGLTANLAAGSLVNGNGNLILSIDGTGTTSGLAEFAFNIGGQTCNLTVPVGCGAYVDVGQWKAFSCYNLGAANTAADPFTPSWEIHGGYWQWGTQLEAAAGPSDASTPNNGPVAGWNTSNIPNGAWNEDLTMPMPNNPCPSGFRVPTLAQWEGVYYSNSRSNVGSWSSSPNNYSAGKEFGSRLVLPATGYRDPGNGALYSRGTTAFYWSSRESGSDSGFYLFFNVSSGGSSFLPRTYGNPVRCIAE